jgi:hypothetical protein
MINPILEAIPYNVERDPILASECEAPGAEWFWAPEFNGEFRTGSGLQIAYYADHHRAGIVYVGSGASGVTVWTDCDSPEDALRRYLEDEIQN